jgi:hypothetical protein
MTPIRRAKQALDSFSLRMYSYVKAAALVSSDQRRSTQSNMDMKTFLMITGLGFAVVAIMVLMPSVAHAATGTMNFGPPQQLRSSFSTAGNGWWHTIAVPGFWGCLIATGFMWFLGFAQYLRWGVGGILFFAFGAQAGKFLMSLGHMSV